MMSNIVFLAERWPFAWRPTSLSPHNLLKNKCLLIIWRFLPPGSKPEFDRPAPEPCGLARLIRPPGGFRDPQTGRRKSLRLLRSQKKSTCQPKLHAVFGLGLIRFCDAFLPRDREFCHWIEQFHGCMSEHLGTFAEAIHRGRQKRRSGASSVVASDVPSGNRLALLVDSPPSACHCFFIHVVVRERASIVCHGCFFRSVEAERAGILCVPSGGRGTLRTGPTYTCATSARKRSAVAS